jgi:glutathione S-transferase
MTEATMSLTLYFHPLSSFCQKALIALYENNTPFTPHVVDLMDPKANADFKAIWPIGKFPVLRDTMRNEVVPETSVIIQYLDQHYPGKASLIPKDAALAREMHLRDRIFDLYMNMPIGKIVTDKLRPAGKNDPHGVDEAKALIQTTLRIVDEVMATRTWAAGDVFTMADCAAAPSLFYANMLMPFGDTHKNAAAYLKRLMERPSYARALKEAEPYFKMMPK